MYKAYKQNSKRKATNLYSQVKHKKNTHNRLKIQTLQKTYHPALFINNARINDVAFHKLWFMLRDKSHRFSVTTKINCKPRLYYINVGKRRKRTRKYKNKK